MPQTSGHSVDYLTLQRSVSEYFSQMRADKPYFSSLLRIGSPAIANKHEFIDDVLKPVISDLTAVSALASPTIVVADATGYEVGSIVRFTSSTGAYKSVMAKITAIVGSTLTVVRPYGLTADVALIATDKCILHSTPQSENTDGQKGKGYEGTFAHNFSQIFRDFAGISGTTAQTKMYGGMDLAVSSSSSDMDILKAMVGGTLSPQLSRAMDAMFDRLNRQINQAALFGVGVQRVNGGEAGSMGGIFNLITQQVAVGGALTKDALNAGFEAIYENGGDSTRYGLVMGTKQARVMSGLKTEANQTIVVKSEGAAGYVGDYAQRFTADCVTGRGTALNATIITDTNLPNDMIAIVDLDRIELTPLGNRFLEIKNATLPGQDGVSLGALSELTLTLRNAGEAHALLTGLTY